MDHKTKIQLAVRMSDRLCAVYRSEYRREAVAEACDNVLDRSGNLLGWLRDYELMTLKHRGPANGDSRVAMPQPSLDQGHGL